MAGGRVDSRVDLLELLGESEYVVNSNLFTKLAPSSSPPLTYSSSNILLGWI